MEYKLNQEERLKIGQKWIEEYEGYNFVKGYMKHFNLSIKETLDDLALLGFGQHEYYLRLKNRRKNNKKKQIRKKELRMIKEILENELSLSDDDENIMMINHDSCDDLPF